jgi:ubiquinone/menaquinone biosynthesis C-methylase UbiE
MARADFNRIASTYDAGRGLTDEAMDVWRAALLRHLPAPPSLPVLDLGCGTGRFSAALARWLEAEVIGIDPSAGMLRAAVGAEDPGVSYLLGRAEDIPLAASACDFAWLSTVIHHFDDLSLVSGELRRVLRPGGAVFIRTWFPGRADVTHFRWFPGAKRIAETFPTIETVERAFARAGFRRRALESVTQVSAPSLRDACERLRLRADTTLQLLSDEEFAEGMRALEAEAAAETEPKPVTSALDFLVLA